MSEMKRVELTTTPTSQKQKKVIRKKRTHRFDLTLGESNSETCPEYSYVELLKSEKWLNGDPFGEPDEDQEVAVIAQRFESKYGPKSLQSGKKSRTQEMDDYYDPGDGYDEDDPFIDNTEAYDEVIPSSMTTQHGGFYINQGKLDFKSLDEGSVDVIKQATKKKKMRTLDSENEEETGVSLVKKLKSMRHKKRLESRDVVKKKRFSETDEGELTVKKKKQKLKNPASSSLFQKDAKTASLLPSVPAATVPTTAASSVTAITSSKTTTTTITNGTAEVKTEMRNDEISAIEEIFNIVLRESMNEDSSSKSGEEGKGEQLTERNTQLPSQLPPELLDAIENMKREAKETKEKKFFSAYINKLLLDIELGSHKLPWGSKTAIYNHLGEHLPYGKYTLQRRAKKLRESQEEDQLKGPRQKLKEAIMKVMPALEEEHEIDVQKARLDAEVKEEESDIVKEEMSTESEGDGKTENQKKARGPRRKFQWNPEIRHLLLDIVSTRMKHYSTFKSRSLSPEEYLKAYLNSDIKPLWPQGWMQTRMLLKESKKAHKDLTKSGSQASPYNIGKHKKVCPILDAAPSSTEITHFQTPKVEDVIEVSNIMENTHQNKDTVVINLPSSVAASSLAFQAPMSSLASSPTVNLGKQLMKATVTTSMVTHNSSSSITAAVSQRVGDTSISLSSKEIVPISLLESSKMSSAQRNDVIIKPVNLALSQGTAVTSGGPSMAFPPANFTSSHTGMEVVDDLNNNGSPKLSLSSQSQQQVRTSVNQQSSSQQKISVLQQKSNPQQQTLNTNQLKLPQDGQNKVNLQQQKATVKSSLNVVVNKDIPHSSWTNMTSVVSASNRVNPADVGNRTTEKSFPKQSIWLTSKKESLQTNQLLLSQSQQQLKMSSMNAKPNQKTQKQGQLGNGSSSPINVNSAAETQMVCKSGVISVNVVPSSKQSSQNEPLVQHEDFQKKSSLSNMPLQSGNVIATSNSVQKSNSQHYKHLQTGIVIGTSHPLQSNSRTAADFTGWTASRPGNLKQPLPPGVLTTSAVRTSPMTASLQPSKPPPGLLSNSIPTSVSRSSIQSPQKSSVSSVDVATLSPYEQIKTQVQNQEAIEGQALKNLAMALKLGGSSNSGLFGTKPGTMGYPVITPELCSKIKRGVGNKLSGFISGSHELSRLERTRQNSQQTDLREPLSRTSSQGFSSDLSSDNDPGKPLQKSEQCSSAKSSSNMKFLDRTTCQALEHCNMSQSQPVSERSKIVKEMLPAGKSCGSSEIQLAVSSKTTNISPVVKKERMEPSISSFLSSEIDILLPTSSPKLQKSSLVPAKQPGSNQWHTSRSSPELSNLGGFRVNESLFRKTNNYTHSSSLLALDHNIFTNIEQSTSGHKFSKSAAEVKFANVNFLERNDTPANRSVNSAPDNSLSSWQTVDVRSSAVSYQQLSCSKNCLPAKEKTQQQSSFNSNSTGSFQDSFARYASQLLKDGVPQLQNIKKTSSQSSSELTNSCSGDISRSLRCIERVESEKHLDQEREPVNNQTTDDR